MARRIYFIFFLISVAVLIITYMYKDEVSLNSLLRIMTIDLMFLVGSSHGLIAHSLKPEVKGGLIVYPVLMGGFFGLFIFIFVYFLMPVYCDCFGFK